MSNDWLSDVRDMHAKFGFHDAVDSMDQEKLEEFLAFRIKFLQEELDEIRSAQTPEEVLDGLVDLAVVTLGTIDAFDCDGQSAWDEVLRANFEKKIGEKATRKNSFGFPDLVKPEGWRGPDYSRISTGLLAGAIRGGA